jgi:hypothetical protein
MTPNANGERSAIRIPAPTEANRRVCSHCGTVQSSVRIRNSPSSSVTNSPIPSPRPQFEVHAAVSPVCFRLPVRIGRISPFRRFESAAFFIRSYELVPGVPPGTPRTVGVRTMIIQPVDCRGLRRAVRVGHCANGPSCPCCMGRRHRRRRSRVRVSFSDRQAGSQLRESRTKTHGTIRVSRLSV